MATQWTAGTVSGQVLTAATLNTIGAAWESYTPTIKGGATTVTATIIYAKYARINKNVIVQVAATVTSAGAANGVVTISLPVGLDALFNSDFRSVGVFVIKDSGVGWYTGVAITSGTTAIAALSYGATNNMGANSPAMTLANGDGVSMSIIYEVA
jgi:hypothetical protein